MLINNEFEVAAPVEKVWQFFKNIPQVAACLPGAELTQNLGGDTYKGKVAVRMGPVRLQFAGTADITERDEAAKRVVVHASGADEKGRGQASMVVTATLARTGRGTTKVGVVQDLQLSGAAAQYGRGMISDVTAVLMRDFAANMQGRIERLDLGDSAKPAAATAATPARGFSLGVRAALMALSRVLLQGRSFSPAAHGCSRLWLYQNTITHLEQQVTDQRLQLEERDEELAAARAANRELMAQLNAAYHR
jgi:carbon monoxide dehydrogenase subunit G